MYLESRARELLYLVKTGVCDDVTIKSHIKDLERRLAKCQNKNSDDADSLRVLDLELGLLEKYRERFSSKTHIWGKFFVSPLVKLFLICLKNRRQSVPITSKFLEFCAKEELHKQFIQTVSTISVSFPSKPEVFMTVAKCYKSMRKFDPILLRAILLRGTRSHPKSEQLWEQLLLLEKNQLGATKDILELILSEAKKHLSEGEFLKLSTLISSE